MLIHDCNRILNPEVSCDTAAPCLRPFFVDLRIAEPSEISKKLIAEATICRVAEGTEGVPLLALLLMTDE